MALRFSSETRRTRSSRVSAAFQISQSLNIAELCLTHPHLLVVAANLFALKSHSLLLGARCMVHIPSLALLARHTGVVL